MNNSSTHDFLVINCGVCGFLINRTQFCASAYIGGNISPHRPSAGEQQQFVYYNGASIPLFDFYGYLTDMFRIADNEEPRIALIVRAQNITKNKSLKEKKESDTGEALTTEYIALRTGNLSSIEHVSLNSIKPYPRPLRKSAFSKGILGIRFTESPGIQYFIDLETTARIIIGENM